MAMIAAMVLTAVGTIASANQQRAAGKAANQAAQFEALQMERQAGEARATSQRQAIEQRRKSDYMRSRAQALAASSGAGALDPTVVDIVSGIEGEGDLAARSVLYEGEVRATNRETAAAGRRFEGENAERAGKAAAAATMLKGAGSMFSMYGAGGFGAESGGSDPSGFGKDFGTATTGSGGW